MAISSSKNILRQTIVAQSVALAIAAFSGSQAFAVPSCAADGNGLITLSSYQSATCVLSSGNSLVVTSSGSTDGGVSAAGAQFGSISNYGSISGGVGISNATLIGAITNQSDAALDILDIQGSVVTGGIQNLGQMNAVYIEAGSLIQGDIVNANSGSLSDGIYISGQSTVSGAIKNEGIASFVDVYDGSVVRGISNTGTIGDIYVTNATVDGAISNAGLVTGQIRVQAGSSVSGGITNSNTVGQINISDSTIANGITNSGTVGYIAVTNGSVVTGGISNTDTISGSSQALYLYGSSVSGGITNHAGAVISSSDYAVYISSDSNVTGGINNAGLISAPGTLSGGHYYSGYGEWISGQVDSITNTGTISANAVGIHLSSSAIISGAISNSGTISGNNFAISIDDGAVVNGGINNTGLLDGQVYLGQSTLNLNGTAGRVTGSISGHNGSVNVNGTFTMENTIDVGTVTIAQGGTLNMGAGNGQSSIYYINSISPVTNNGTLIVNPGVDNRINGDYIQTATGVFQSNVSGIAQYGKLRVSGTADLTQGSIKINTSTPSLMLMDGAVDTILSAGTLNFNPNLAITDTSLLFDFQATQVGNNLELKTVASSNSGDTATGSVNDQGNSAGRGAAAVIDQLIAQGNAAPSAFLPVINTLGTLDSQKKVSDAISETLPLMTAGMTQSTLNTLHGTNQVIQSRQEANLGRSSGDEFLGDRQFWFKPLGSWAKQNDRNGVAGYDADTYGMVFGVDGTLSDKTTIGGAFAYTSTKVDSNSDVAKQHADVDGYQLAVYGAYKLDDRTSITYQGDIGNNQVSGDRRIAFMGTTADSDFSSWSAHVGAGIGKTMDLSERTTFTPSIRVDYTRLRTDSYTEKGAGALNLRVDGDTVEELILGVDAAFSHTLSTNASLVGNLGIGYDTMNEQSSVTASYVGGGAAFATKGIDPSPWVMRGGLGVVMHNGPLVSVTARYDVEARESFTNQTASVKVGIKF